MPSRMDRYNSNSNNSTVTRTSKNEKLYEDLYNNKRYTEITSLEKDNIVELSDSNDDTINNRRSNYNHTRNRLFYGDKNIGLKEETPSYSSYQKILNEDNKEKIYNVNDVLALARQNRKIEDEEEKQKKIKSMEYSILSDLSQEKVKEYHEKKEKGISREEAENLEELINTITSNSLRNRIDEELLGDLLPDDEHQTLVSDELLSELKEYDNSKITNSDSTSSEDLESTSEQGIDKSFYTRSMDLKKEDLIYDKDDEEDEELENLFKDEKDGSIVKTIIVIILALVVVSIIGYIILKFI